MITDKQRIVYEYICSFLEENGYPPTEREIAEGTKVALVQLMGNFGVWKIWDL